MSEIWSIVAILQKQELRLPFRLVLFTTRKKKYLKEHADQQTLIHPGDSSFSLPKPLSTSSGWLAWTGMTETQIE